MRHRILFAIVATVAVIGIAYNVGSALAQSADVELKTGRVAVDNGDGSWTITEDEKAHLATARELRAIGAAIKSRDVSTRARDLAALIADMKTAPATAPDVLRLEQALALLVDN